MDPWGLKETTSKSKGEERAHPSKAQKGRPPAERSGQRRPGTFYKHLVARGEKQGEMSFCGNVLDLRKSHLGQAVGIAAATSARIAGAPRDPEHI